MIRIVKISLLLLLCCYNANGMDMDLQIQLPDVKMMLPPVTPPQLLKEGLPLFRENPIVKGLFEHLNKGDYEGSLAYLRLHETPVLELIEKGDPDGRLKQLAVVGGIVMAEQEKISAYFLYLIGHTYFSLKKYKAAETAFLGALVPIPDYIRVHESLGVLYMRMKRYKEAQKHLAHAAELGLHTAQLFGSLGYLDFQTKDFWGAVNAFQEALMMNPDNEQWKTGLLYALGETYQYKATLTLVESMLREQPDIIWLWLFRARAAYMAGERKVALSSLETAIRLGDHKKANLQACAALHMELGSIERAVDLLKSGFEEGMDFIYFDQGMSWLYQAKEWTLFEQMVAWMRGKWKSLDELQQSKVLMREADISIHKGNKSAASNSLEKAIALDPSNAYALMSLAGIYLEKGSYNRAELLYQRASAYGLFRENALISLAQVAIDQEDYERALQILRDMLKEFPSRTDLQRNIESLENIVMLQSDN